MLLLYEFLLRLYPAAYRAEYAEEMVDVLSEVLTEHQKKGALSLFLSAGYEITGLLKGAVREHISLVTGSSRGGKSLSRRLTMHSDFRFPKVTVTLMGLILLAVFLAIQKAKDIQASIAYANPQAGPIHATQQLALFPTFLFVLASACIIGLLGWVILFALRRSGSHRLSDVDTSSRPDPGSSLSL